MIKLFVTHNTLRRSTFKNISETTIQDTAIRGRAYAASYADAQKRAAEAAAAKLAAENEARYIALGLITQADRAAYNTAQTNAAAAASALAKNQARYLGSGAYQLGIGKTAQEYLSGKSVFDFKNLRPEIQGQIINATTDAAERARLQGLSQNNPYEEIRRRTAALSAQSAAIKQTEARALGQIVGTAQAGQAGTQNETAFQSTQFQAPPPVTPQIYKVQLQDSISLSEGISQADVINPLGGKDIKVNIQDSLSAASNFDLTRSGVFSAPPNQIEAQGIIPKNAIPLLTPAALIDQNIPYLLPQEVIKPKGTVIKQEGLDTIRLDQPPKPSLDQQLEQLTTNVGTLAEQRRKSGDEVSAGVFGFTEQILADFKSGVNLERQGGVLFRNALVPKSKLLSSSLGANLLKESKTAPNEALAAPFSAIGESVKVVPSKNAFGFGLNFDRMKFSTSIGEAGGALSKLVQSQGIGRTIGQIGAVIIPYSPSKIPIRLATIPIATGLTKKVLVKEVVGGFGKGFFKIGGTVVTKEIEKPIIKQGAKTLLLGFGGTKSIPLVTKTASGLSLGSPLRVVEKIGLQDLVTQGRGLELGSIRGFERSVLTSTKALNKLVEYGKIRPQDIETVRTLEELSTLAAKSPKARQLKEIAAPQEKAPLTSLRAGAESEAFLELLPKLPKSKGGFAQNLQVLAERQTGDLDVDFAGIRRGTQKAEKLAQEGLEKLLAAAASENVGRGFRKSGTKVFSGFKTEEKVPFPTAENLAAPQQLKNEEKVLEFLTKKDVIGNAQSSPATAGKDVFGFSSNKGKTKIKLPSGKTAPVITLQGQALRKIVSVGSIQSKGTEGAELVTVDYLKAGKKIETTAQGGRISPPSFRLKDVADLAGKGQIIDTLAFLYREKGKVKQAVRLGEINQKLRKLFPEVDVDSISKSDPISFVNEAGRAKGLLKSGGQVSPALIQRSASLAPKEVAQGFRIEKPSVQKPNEYPSINKLIQVRKLNNLIDSQLLSVTKPSRTPFDFNFKSPSAPVRASQDARNFINSVSKFEINSSLSKGFSSKSNEVGLNLNALESIGASPANSKLSKSMERIINLSTPSGSPSSLAKSYDFSLPKPSKPSGFESSKPSVPSITKPSPVTFPSIGAPSPARPSAPSPVFPSPVFPSPVFPPSPPKPVPTRTPSPPRFPSGGGSVGTFNIIPPRVIPPRRPPFILGRKQSERRARKLPSYSKSLTFVADPADPLRAGVLLPKGVNQLVSGNARIFKQIDRDLAKARKKAKNFNPLGENIIFRKR